MKKIYLLIAFGLWAIATALNQPPIGSHGADRGEALLIGAQTDKKVLSIFERSCQNCHSSATEWPLYSRLYPISALIEHDVLEARSHMDLSQWQSYDDTQKRRILAEIGSVVRNGVMPPARYTLVHPEAKLSPDDISAIYQWTRSNRNSLKRAQANP